MLVTESGSRMSRKKRSGPAPSIFAASTTSSGTVRKNWRNSSVAVALAISGTVSPAMRVEQVEVHDHLVGRDDPHLHRQHQGEEDRPEGQHAAGEGEEGDGVGREQRDGDLAAGDQHRHQRAVPQHQRGRARSGSGRRRCPPGRGVVLHRLARPAAAARRRGRWWRRRGWSRPAAIQMGSTTASTPSSRMRVGEQRRSAAAGAPPPRPGARRVPPPPSLRRRGCAGPSISSARGAR